MVTALRDLDGQSHLAAWALEVVAIECVRDRHDGIFRLHKRRADCAGADASLRSVGPCVVEIVAAMDESNVQRTEAKQISGRLRVECLKVRIIVGSCRNLTTQSTKWQSPKSEEQQNLALHGALMFSRLRAI